MTQAHVDRAVARATGESLKTIRSRGFSIMDPAEPGHEPDPSPALPQVVDWDQLAIDRQVLFPAFLPRRRAVA